jgi:3-oxoacyl-[acyl-carrier-protein] synthase II
LSHAQKRGADIYAELTGFGMSCDAHHMTQPSAAGIAKAILKAIQHAKIKPKDVDYFCAHGTGTKENDKAESQMMRDVFGSHTKKLLVSSIKSMLGHTMGAASALETIACCLAIRHGLVPPTINFETPDPECDINCVPNHAVQADLNVVLNNSQAFGGNNCCLVLQKIH